uniref:uncharacterized protein n=1 Tax=Myxine glutinosa TaxID=7769 RepID=UPI00358EF32C
MKLYHNLHQPRCAKVCSRTYTHNFDETSPQPSSSLMYQCVFKALEKLWSEEGLGRGLAEKTFVDWFYTADRQESPLALWQDPCLWGFFWFVLLLPKILDFLVIWLWRKLQDNNCHKEKVKSFCCLPKLPSRMKLNQTKGDYTRFDTVSHFKDRQVADRSLSKDPNKMRNCSTNLIVKSKAESFPKLVLPLHKVCRTIHSPPPRPCAASPPPALRETVVYQVVRVIRFTRQMTGGERLVFTQQIQFSGIMSMNSFESGIADVHIQVMEMVSSSHRIAIGGSGKMMQLMKAPEIGDQKQHLKSSEEQAAVMEMVSSSHRIPIEGSGEMMQLMKAPEIGDQKQHLKSSEEQAAVMEMVSSSHRIAIEGSGKMMQLMKAPEIGDQMQHLKSRHSVLPLLHEPQAKKATMKKKDLTIPDRPESRRHPQLRSDIKKVTEEYGNGIVTIRECEDIDEVFIDLRLEIWVMQLVITSLGQMNQISFNPRGDLQFGGYDARGMEEYEAFNFTNTRVYSETQPRTRQRKM